MDKYSGRLKRYMSGVMPLNTSLCRMLLQKKYRALSTKLLKNSISMKRSTTIEGGISNDSKFEFLQLLINLIIVKIYETYNNNRKRKQLAMLLSSTEFKQHLTQMRSDFNSYLKQHKTKGMPIDHLSVLLQKYLTLHPKTLESMLSRSIMKQEVTWQNLLIYIQNQVILEDQVNKMKIAKPSVIDVTFYQDVDEHLQQRLTDVIAYIKKKSTNYIKFVVKTEFLGFKMLVVILEKEAIFYDCEGKVIVKIIQFRYNNVRNKIINTFIGREKNLQYNQSGLRQNFSSEVKYSNNLSYKNKLEEMDKVAPITRRTQQNVNSFSYKSRKNTNQTQQLKNVLSNNMKNSKVVSSKSGNSEANDINNLKRSITLIDPHKVQGMGQGSLYRESTKVYRFGSHNQKEKTNKKDILKVRSNDTGQILQIITDSKVQGSIQTIKAYKSSIETFQKYVQIDKSKIERQKQLFEQYKLPSHINIKTDYKKQISKMREISQQLSMKKNSYEIQKNFSGKKKISIQSRQRNSKKIRSLTEYEQSSEKKTDHKNLQSNAFVVLEKKLLQIQSISFCDSYMFVTLMNCEVRLYFLKKTIYGFSEQLIFQKDFDSFISYGCIYKSNVRKQYNICLFQSSYSSSQNILNKNKSLSNQSGLGKSNSNSSIPKAKQTEVIVYQLDSNMRICKQAFQTFLSYTPIIVSMLPLGLTGFIQSGNFFVLQLNSTYSTKSQRKPVDMILQNPDTCDRVSISTLKVHNSFINLYIGSKDGYIFVFDRMSSCIRNKNKVMNSQIIEIKFILGGDQILIWDSSGKFGIANAENLVMTHTIGLVPALGKNMETGGGSSYWGLSEYFTEQDFIIFGDRNLGLIHLYENSEKKFNFQKPIKMYNRRLSLKNRTKQLQVEPDKSLETIKISNLNSGSAKKIYHIFTNSQSLIVSTVVGQILTYDNSCVYIGSYFTLNYLTLTQCATCPSNKYLYMLHENNQMQVINIYTQDQIINIVNVKDQVHDIFFCNSHVYFCGYLAAKKYILYIYGYGQQGYEHRGNNSPIVVVNLSHLIISPKLAQPNAERKHIQTNSNSANLDIKFYKGNSVIIKKTQMQVIFLYKKTYTRNCAIKLTQFLKQTSVTEDQRLEMYITHAYLDLQANLISLISSNNIFFVINLDSKSIKGVYELERINQFIPIQHHYDSQSSTVSVVSRNWQQIDFQNKNQPKYSYTKYQLSTNKQENTIKPFYSILKEPNPLFDMTSKIKRKNSKIKRSIEDKEDPKEIDDDPNKFEWISHPNILGNSFYTLSSESTYLNFYKLQNGQQSINKTNKTISNEKEQSTQIKSSYEVKHYKISTQ